MIDITDENFINSYPTIEKAVKSASFIAIDTEFTGIRANDDFHESLFDRAEQRYDMLRENIKPYIIVQFGLTTYEHCQERNAYKAFAFNFYLLPRSIPTKNRQFLWQVFALEFLSSHMFDFNKSIYHGISYVNEIEEAEISKQLLNDSALKDIEGYLSYKDEESLQTYNNLVKNWLISKDNVEDTMRINTPTPILQYFTQKELRRNFPNIWTLSDSNSVVVIKVAEETRQIIEAQSRNALESSLLEHYIGFSKLFKLLVNSKKPIVGHNLLLDLMFMHQQFYKPLPKKYHEFKKNIHELFPSIYDTKFISYELRKITPKEVQWKSNSLSGLYEYFKNEPGKYLSLNSPSISLEKHSVEETEKYHTAGWDAYFTGYVFVKMSHFYAVQKYGSGCSLKDLTNAELLSGVQDFRNCVNVIRSQLSHIKLDGSDPDCKRPEWLLVKALKGNSLKMSQVAEQLSAFGSVDIRRFTSQRFLVAVANHRSARSILQHFRRNKEYAVAPYRNYARSPAVKIFLWSSVFLSGGVIAWVLQNSFRKA